jgi:hypothetical protein
VPNFGRLDDCINEEQGVEDPTRGLGDAQLRSSGLNSREREKLQGVSSVHSIQCHTQLEDAADIVLTEKEKSASGETY